jgi:hypothetical protein
MHNNLIASIDRRVFLRMGALLGLLGAAGCDSSNSTGPPSTPPKELGNRKRLELRQEKAAEAATKKK